MLTPVGPFAPNLTKWTLFGSTIVCWALGSMVVGCVAEPASSVLGTGGAPASPGSGGATASSGGATQPNGTGGATASGGANASGGTGSGGMVATSSGGSNASGGTTASGGATATGGSGTGGAAAGGRGGRGGTTNTGGSSTGGAAAGGTGTGGNGAGGTTHTGVWKVTLLGESVTGTCYPQLFSKTLIAGGHTNFQFVGTITNNGSCGAGAPSVKTEAHGGYGVTYMPSTSTRPKCTKQSQGCGSYAELQTWAAVKPDIVFMHFATNDCWDGEPPTLILSSYLAVIAEYRKQNPNVIFFVSKIIPLTPALANAMTLNAAVTPAWAAANSTSTSMIHIVDHWTGFNAATDTVDGVHPTAAGAQKMATTSFNAIMATGYF